MTGFNNLFGACCPYLMSNPIDEDDEVYVSMLRSPAGLDPWENTNEATADSELSLKPLLDGGSNRKMGPYAYSSNVGSEVVKEILDEIL